MAKTTPRWAGLNVHVYGNDNMDLTAPGVRDLVGNPSAFAANSYRSQLYDNHSLNAAPAMAESWFDTVTKPAFQRLGSFWYTVTHQVCALSTPGFIERGQFITPYTGFTAFRYLRPHTTLGVMQ